MSTPLREHVECARHSGLPWCCIAWYLGPWRLMAALDHRFAPVEDIGGIAFVMDGLTVRYLARAPWGYVPCPACIVRGRRVEMRKCRCDVDARMAP